MSIKSLLSITIFYFLFSVLTAQNAEFIGASKCKMCHNKSEKGDQYKKWIEGPHAKAMEVLSADEAKNPNCLKCHSTAANVDPDLVTESISVEEGVSCESCHGPGSIYKSMKIMKSREEAIKNGLVIPTAEVCQKCHNEESPNFKGFNFDEYYARIAHELPVDEE